MQVVVTFSGQAFESYAARLNVLGTQGKGILVTALNEGGHLIREATIGAETAQTGHKRNVLERAQHEKDASTASLAYTIWSEGGDIGLKYFGAKEGGGGVSAHPFNRQTFFGGAFITSGRPGTRRQSAKLNGQVYVNDAGGTWGGDIIKKKSGVVIPTEMTKGQTAAAFEVGAERAMSYVVTKLRSKLP